MQISVSWTYLFFGGGVILLMFGWVSAFSKQKVKEKEKDKEKDKDSSEKPKEKVKAEKSEKAKEQKSKEKEKERSKSKEKEGKEKSKERLKDKDKERSGNKSKYSSPAGVPESPKDGEYEKGQCPSPPLLSLIALALHWTGSFNKAVLWFRDDKRKAKIYTLNLLWRYHVCIVKCL